MTVKKETRGFSNFGFSSILLSFVMICVVTFSALSLVSANSDYKLSRKVAEKNQLYYEAQEKATEKLVAVEQLLMDCYLNAPDESKYYSHAENALAKYGVMENTTSGYYLSLEEPISDNNTLSIKISIHYPTENDEAFYEILEWKSVYEREFPEDEPLNLMD